MNKLIFFHLSHFRTIAYPAFGAIYSSSTYYACLAIISIFLAVKTFTTSLSTAKVMICQFAIKCFFCCIQRPSMSDALLIQFVCFISEWVLLVVCSNYP